MWTRRNEERLERLNLSGVEKRRLDGSPCPSDRGKGKERKVRMSEGKERHKHDGKGKAQLGEWRTGEREIKKK